MKLDPRQTRALQAGALFVASAAFVMLGGCKMNEDNVTVNSKSGAPNSSEPDSTGPKTSAPDLAVSITVAEAPKIGTGLTLDAVFENRGDTPQTIITPQDGSFEGWLSPTYEVAVTRDTEEKPLGIGGRCGNHGGFYNDRTMKVVKPGERLTVRLITPYLFADAGSYTATLRYAVKPNAYPGESYHAPSMEDPNFRAWPDGVFVGEVASKSIAFDVK